MRLTTCSSYFARSLKFSLAKSRAARFGDDRTDDEAEAATEGLLCAIAREVDEEDVRASPPPTLAAVATIEAADWAAETATFLAEIDLGEADEKTSVFMAAEALLEAAAVAAAATAAEVSATDSSTTTSIDESSFFNDDADEEAEEDNNKRSAAEPEEESAEAISTGGGICGPLDRRESVE